MVVIANSFFQRIIALTSHVCVSVFKRDILFQTLSTVSHATSPSPQFFSKELAQITLVLLLFHFKIWMVMVITHQLISQQMLIPDYWQSEKLC